MAPGEWFANAYFLEDPKTDVLIEACLVIVLAMDRNGDWCMICDRICVCVHHELHERSDD